MRKDTANDATKPEPVTLELGIYFRKPEHDNDVISSADNDVIGWRLSRRWRIVACCGVWSSDMSAPAWFRIPQHTAGADVTAEKAADCGTRAPQSAAIRHL